MLILCRCVFVQLAGCSSELVLCATAANSQRLTRWLDSWRDTRVTTTTMHDIVLHLHVTTLCCYIYVQRKHRKEEENWAHAYGVDTTRPLRSSNLRTFDSSINLQPSTYTLLRRSDAVTQFTFFCTTCIRLHRKVVVQARMQSKICCITYVMCVHAASFANVTRLTIFILNFMKFNIFNWKILKLN